MSEADLQRAAFRFVRYSWPHVAVFHPPNGAKRTNGGNLKSQGLTSGIPDLVIPWPAGGWPSLYVELKVGKNKTTEAQDNQITKLRSAGNLVAICYTLDEFMTLLTLYMEEKPIPEDFEPITRVVDITGPILTLKK